METFRYGGTAFLVSIGSKQYPEDFSHLYLVTAKHCVQEPNGTPYDLYIRLNKKDGTATQPLALPYKWVTLEDDEAVDIAMMPFDVFDDPQHHFSHIPIESAAIKDSNRNFGIGLGTEVRAIGLFTPRIGKQRNLPIVRAGIISCMPDELEDTNTRLPFTAYLIELQSIGGLSGSPVFVFSRSDDSIKTRSRGASSAPFPYFPPGATTGYSFRLLGLIRGHFETAVRRRALQQQSDMAFSDDEWDKIHNGIAIITPAEEIIKLLNDDRLVKQRDEKDRALVSARVSVND